MQSADWRTLDALVLSNYEPNRDCLELLKACHFRHPTGLLSNTRREWFEYLDRSYGITKHVDRAFLSYKLGLKKPDPKIYRHVIGELKQRPNDVVFLDDREENVVAARNEGLQAFVFTSTSDAVSQLQRRGVQLDTAMLPTTPCTPAHDNWKDGSL